jgi:hypothetical protein
MFKKVRDEKLQSIQDNNVSDALSKITKSTPGSTREDSIVDEDEIIDILIALKRQQCEQNLAVPTSTAVG